MAKKPEEKTPSRLASIFQKIWPGRKSDLEDEKTAYIDVQNQGALANGLHGEAPTFLDADAPDPVSASTGEFEQFRDVLPLDRVQRYAILATMERDPSVSAAIKLHVAQAMASKPGTGEIISIESTSDNDHPIVKDLRDTFKDLINERCPEWAYNTAIYGGWYARVYGKPGAGVTYVRSDYYTHPRFMREYERAGQLAGFTHAYQNISKTGYVQLIEPWKFVGFKIPAWHTPVSYEPIRNDQASFDIVDDDVFTEQVIESQSYGESMLVDAYEPWMDLNNAILSLNMSRRNAARLERLVGVNTGRLSPQKAAEYLNTIAAQLQKANEVHAKQAVSKGFFQTVINHLLPIFGDRGRLDISTVEGSPNIEGLEDLMFHVKRLSGALGVDPSLIGFGDMLSGGLGEGGFFRMSVMAAIKSHALRSAIRNGVEELFNIHVAYKHNKYFMPGQRPWRLTFHSVNSALEREEQENQDGRVNFATLLTTLVQMVDPEFSKVDFKAFNNYLWTDILRVDEEKFNAMFPNITPEAPESEEPNNVFESADAIKAIVEKFYAEIGK